MNHLPEIGIRPPLEFLRSTAVDFKLKKKLHWNQKTVGDVWTLSPRNGSEYWSQHAAIITQILEWHGGMIL